MQVILTNVRLSYPHLFTAKAAQGSDKAKYSASFLLDKGKDAKQIKTVQAAIDSLLAEKFKGKKLPADKICLRDGDAKDDENYAGKFYINASNDKRPQVVDTDKTPLASDDNKPYAGCYVNGVLRLWAQDNQYGKRINASLEAVQFWKDGEPFGAPAVSLDVLPDMTSDDEDDL